jgi:hypothetical protein
VERSFRPVWPAAAAGTVLTAAFFYPGYFNGDSYWQYQQGLSGVYDDLHPVIMSWLWTRLDRVVEGPGGLFLVTTALFWTGLAMFARAFTRRRAGFLVAVFAVGLSPPVFSMLSQIHKDVGMVTGLLLGYALLLRADRSRSWRPLVLALPALWYAVAVRHNGVTAVVPFTIWSSFLLVRDRLSDGMRSRLASPLATIALGIAMAAAMVGLATFASRAILGEKGVHTPPLQMLFAYDLIGISVRSGQDYLPTGLYHDPPRDRDELRRIYDPRTAYFVYWGRGKARRLQIVTSPDVTDALASAWREAIREQPWSYAEHRTWLFLAHLGIPRNTPFRKLEFLGTGESYVGFNPYRGLTVFATPHNRWLVGAYEAAGGFTFSSTPGRLWAEDTGFLFRPWPYLLLSLLCVLAAWRTRSANRFQIALLGASSLAYVLPHLVIGISSELRYMWWPILVSLLQPIMLADGLARRAVEPGSHSDQAKRTPSGVGQPSASEVPAPPALSSRARSLRRARCPGWSARPAR